jgi:hypothetical protein
MRAAKTIALIALAVLVLVASYRIAYPTYTYRYRMTINVAVGGEVRSGSSVIEVSVGKHPKIFPDEAVLSESVRGEAVFVDLGDNRNVIGLLTAGQYAEIPDYPSLIVPRVFNLNTFTDSGLAQLPLLRGVRHLAKKDWPTLVTVPDPAESKGVTAVEPSQFSQVFGARVAISDVTIELTTDPVTSNIGRRLPWVDAGLAKGLGSVRYGYSNRFNVNIPDFKRT